MMHSNLFNTSIYLVGSSRNCPSIVIPRSYYSERSPNTWPVCAPYLMITFKAKTFYNDEGGGCTLHFKDFATLTEFDFASILLGQERIQKVPMDRWYSDIHIDDHLIHWLVRYCNPDIRAVCDKHPDTTAFVFKKISDAFADVLYSLIW